jgi:hypothetical protein
VKRRRERAYASNPKSNKAREAASPLFPATDGRASLRRVPRRPSTAKSGRLVRAPPSASHPSYVTSGTSNPRSDFNFSGRRGRRNTVCSWHTQRSMFLLDYTDPASVQHIPLFSFSLQNFPTRLHLCGRMYSHMVSSMVTLCVWSSLSIPTLMYRIDGYPVDLQE